MRGSRSWEGAKTESLLGQMWSQVMAVQVCRGGAGVSTAPRRGGAIQKEIRVPKTNVCHVLTGGIYI